MIEYWGHIVGVISLVLLALFIGVWIWAWRPRHKRVFERMARLPLERDERPDVDDDWNDESGQADGSERR
ncbi:MAG: cbb3-type cytochrome c oxidase subunit 3 [Halofilum sp. (in: g-proteobacteria)]|nr:cbb3-type cytochrome c oxidase subunit 3 [Halofilum sp. (in: g-proteobacteria)]